MLALFGVSNGTLEYEVPFLRRVFEKNNTIDHETIRDRHWGGYFQSSSIPLGDKIDLGQIPVIVETFVKVEKHIRFLGI